MKNKTLLLALALGSALSAGELRAQTIGVQFTYNSPSLQPDDIAGLVPQGNFHVPGQSEEIKAP